MAVNGTSDDRFRAAYYAFLTATADNGGGGGQSNSNGGGGVEFGGEKALSGAPRTYYDMLLERMFFQVPEPYSAPPHPLCTH
jgi:hypothetical protein